MSEGVRVGSIRANCAPRKQREPSCLLADNIRATFVFFRWFVSFLNSSLFLNSTSPSCSPSRCHAIFARGRYGSDSCSESDDEDDEYREGIAYFDTEEVAGDGPSPSGSTGGRLTTAQASRLLVLMSHARTCPGRHAKAQHAEVCRSTKFLMLHIRDCTG